MAVTDLIFSDAARSKLLCGAKQLRDAVAATLGPKGRNALIKRPMQKAEVTKDGVTVARNIELGDPFEAAGAQVVLEAASRTSEVAGDGTTTATILATAILEAALTAVAAGHDPVSLSQGIERAALDLVTGLRKMTQPVDGSNEIKAIATVSANGNTEIGEMIAKAFDAVGRDGTITIDESKQLDTTLDVVEGIQIDAGWISPYFVTNEVTAEAELDNPYVLIVEGSINGLNRFVPLLKVVSEANREAHGADRPLFVLTAGLEGDALAVLVVNKVRGELKSCAVKTPGWQDQRRAILEDIAAVTGATLFGKDSGRRLDECTLADLGSAKRIIVGQRTTTIIEGGGDRQQVETRIEQARAMLKAAEGEFECQKLRERLAKLAGGVAVIRLGARTETELLAKKALVKNALHATVAALEEGILPGGGVALCRCSDMLGSLPAEDDIASTSREMGFLCVRRAALAPFRWICANAGQDPNMALFLLRQHGDNPRMGFDAAEATFCDMVEAGVIDPTKVTRAALENAVSVAVLLLTTETVVVEHVEKRDPSAYMGPPR